MPRSQNWLANGLISGAASATAISAALAAFGKSSEDSPWVPFNAIAHMVFGEESVAHNEFLPKETLTGLGLNASALATWSLLYEKLAGQVRLPQSLLTGAAASAVIYLLDYHVFPERFRPGFEKRLGSSAVVASYVLLALALGLSPLWKKDPPVHGGI